MSLRRQRVTRAIVWDPASYSILDLASRRVAASPGPSESLERVSVASGSERAIRRKHEVQIPLRSEDEIRLAELMVSRLEAEAKCLLLGSSGAQSWVWLEPSRCTVATQGASALSFAPATLRLANNIFRPAIAAGFDLTAFAPFSGLDANASGELDVDGYEGPVWTGSSTLSVDLTGATNEFNFDLQFECPAWGATLALEAAGDSTVTGSVEALDRTGTQLATDTEELTLPTETWEVRVTIGGQVVKGVRAKPLLTLSGPGSAFGPLAGDIDGTSPAWEGAELNLTAEDTTQ